MTMNDTILRPCFILERTLRLKDIVHCFKRDFFPLFFQRLVEAAEDAYLKHEFDADLQVINDFLKYLSL